MFQFLARFTVLGIFIASPVMAESVLALNTSNTAPYANDGKSGFQDRLAIEIFSRIGKRISLHRVQTERALLNVDQGIDDGNLIRVAGLTALYPNIRQVSEPLFEYDFVAFARSDMTFNVHNLPKENHQIGIIRGWKILEERFMDSDSVTFYPNEQKLFESLLTGESEIIIYERWRGLYLINEMEMKEYSLRLPPLIGGRSMYIYLNKKHAELIPEIDEAIRNVKSDGTYEKIFKESLKPYIHDD